MSVGILVHGRHLRAVNWERLVWGEPPYKLGSLPMAVLTILNRGPEHVRVVVFGTGASERDGLKEAEYTKKFLLETLRYQNRLQDFEVLKKHPRFQSTRDIVAVSAILDTVICELSSQNTVEEIQNAAHIFAAHHVEEVVQITCASHAPRCVATAAIAEERGLIPSNQFWSVVRDHMTYEGTSAKDVVIIEPPHRGDDPMLGQSIQAYEVFPKFFSLKRVEDKLQALHAIEHVLAQQA